MAVIETRHLSKYYGGRRGVEDVSLEVERGEIFGFLGPNGAGKTTTIRLLLGFLRPSGGEARLFGLETRRHGLEIRRRTGYLPSDVSLYPNLRGREVVEFTLATRGLRAGRRVEELSRRLDVDLGLPVKQLSRGMRQKVALVAALAHEPELILLDEPDAGLDPLMQRTLEELLREEVARGRTVFLSSHHLAQVEALCHRVAVIREGRVVAVDEVASLRRMRLKRVQASFAQEPPSLEGLEGVRDVRREGRRLVFHVSGDLRPVLRRLAESELSDLSVEEPSLEEVFLAYFSGAEGGGRP
ncbi:MAG: ABC transporter ATP-binding protein [Bacillota bacterium]|nr:ABC transporter ATP-binding protein [Bacillota bacterium]MDI3317789.1 ABC transporter ATP-binding protein [Bacillota bacterium]